MGIYSMIRYNGLKLAQGTYSTRFSRAQLDIVEHLDIHSTNVFVRKLEGQVVQEYVGLQRISQGDVNPESFC